MRTARAPRFAAFDASVALTAEQAAAFYAAGYRTVFRYVDRVISDPDKDDRWPYNLTRKELDILLDAGLYVSIVQYFSCSYESTRAGKRYSTAYGGKAGEIAAVNAGALGIPQGVTIWNDLEGCPDATPDMIEDYCNGWSEAIVSHGYAPGLYVGSGLGSQATGYMVGSRLYALPRYRAYWRAASLVPQIPNRGYTVTQGCEITIAGVRVDQDMIALDHRAKSSRDRFLVVAP
jgi:hypothetical protein